MVTGAMGGGFDRAADTGVASNRAGDLGLGSDDGSADADEAELPPVAFQGIDPAFKQATPDARRRLLQAGIPAGFAAAQPDAESSDDAAEADDRVTIVTDAAAPVRHPARA